MPRKVINTPKLLASQYGVSLPVKELRDETTVKYKSVTSEGVKREKLEKKRVNEEVQLGGLATPKPPPPTFNIFSFNVLYTIILSDINMFNESIS